MHIFLLLLRAISPGWVHIFYSLRTPECFSFLWGGSFYYWSQQNLSNPITCSLCSLSPDQPWFMSQNPGLAASEPFPVSNKIRNNWSELLWLLKPRQLRDGSHSPNLLLPFFSKVPAHQRGDLAPHKAVKGWLDKALGAARKCDSSWKSHQEQEGLSSVKLDKIWSRNRTCLLFCWDV